MNNLSRAEIEKRCIQHYVDRGNLETDSIAYLSHALNTKDDSELMRIYNCILKEENIIATQNGESLQNIFGQM